MGIGRPDLGARHLRVVGNVWAFRAQLEENAAARFSSLGRRLEAVGARPAVLALAQRAVGDEGRHAALCASMANLFGGAAQGPAPKPGEIAPARMDEPDRVLYEVVAFCCLTETVNAALMTATLRVAEALPVRAAVREILRDEVGHARLGWGHLAAARAEGRGDFLGDLLPNMLRGTVQEELFVPDEVQEADSAGLLAHGELPKRTRLGVFEATLRDVIFPGLEQANISTSPGRRWLEGALSVIHGADEPTPSAQGASAMIPPAGNFHS